jgi:hypothetical protein
MSNQVSKQGESGQRLAGQLQEVKQRKFLRATDRRVAIGATNKS